jgi:deoxyribonuclease V
LEVGVIVCLDVQYADPEALVGAVYFADWGDERAVAEVTARVEGVEAYEPGAFYKRELPCLLAGLKAGGREVELVVIDGYVWLDGAGRPGLGAHLYEALGKKTVVVGVSKTMFHDDGYSARVLRPGSSKPLFVTAAGMGQEEAAACVRRMHGEHRVPTLLKRVDRLARGG